ncbi:hypothetical protein [Nocardia arthritidis]|uniref:Uncharacterized protein n=1 Tax=Nocardia arthritidis TaxID=228602 RepID=A0A6G9YHB7_9NOCA|nr:hypothetical protein [Nocardia arthritidis]QIS12695.1 hypothetical protein F5544_24190 [Nocardia arthritidis]
MDPPRFRDSGLAVEIGPKGTDLSRHPVEELTAVAHALKYPALQGLGW